MDNMRQFTDYARVSTGRNEMVDMPLYDTVQLCRGSFGQQTLKFFKRPMGACGATPVDTNMALSGHVPFAYWIDGIAVEIYDSDFSQYGWNAYNAYLRLFIMQKVYIEHGPLFSFIRSHSELDRRYVPYPLNHGLGILAHQMFGVEIVWPKAPRLKEDARIRVELCGTRLRPVQ